MSTLARTASTAILALALNTLPGLAQAGDTEARQTGRKALVVELYTALGCVKCPPADAFLAELAREPGVVPLALHVDYWDYMGRDVFSDPAFSRRQKRYARHSGASMVYTPQFFIAGEAPFEGFKPDQIRAAIASAQLPAAAPVRLDVTRVGAVLHIALERDGAVAMPLMVELVRYLPLARADVVRADGEEAQVEYANVVTSWQSLGSWEDGARLELDARLEGEGPAVVLVQEPGPARILAAVQID